MMQPNQSTSYQEPPRDRDASADAALAPSEDQSCTCKNGGAGSNGTPAFDRSFVYAVGRIEARFPRPSVEKELAQAIGRVETAGQTDHQAIASALSRRENRYLVRQMCWVLTIQGVDTYILRPRDPGDWELLVAAARPVPSDGDMNVVVGLRGPIAPPDVCNGLMVPIVAFDQIYSFGRGALLSAVPRPAKIAPEQFGPAAEELLDRILQMTDNAGATDEHRATNYLALRYPAVYAAVADAHARECALTAVDVRPSRLSGTRKIYDVVFTFTNRHTDVAEKSFVRVDVTEMFPFLVTKLSPYYER